MYTVYVVDDDQVILDEIINTISWQDNGFEVAGWTTSPTVAIAQIGELCPDVVFTDLKMPGMDGVDMIKSIQDKNVACEYVMLSAYDSFEDSRSFFRLNGFDYILKPINLPEVQIILERLATKLSRTKPFIQETFDKVTPAFTELITYLNENYNQKHTLDTLAKRFCLGTNYICNLFAKHLNSSLTRYITRIRMQAALEMMQTTDKVYKEIAIDCGYNNYYYFCKVFKEFYGASPTSYMRTNNANYLKGDEQ